MVYKEENFLQLSALQHFVFCERQCALIHIEQAWSENIFTAEGRLMHENAHEEQFETRGDVHIERGMPLRSEKLGLNGKADVVEFHKTSNSKAWIPFPVEYKHGKPKKDNCDTIQLCAQALCLEEMLGINIPAGAIFYGKTRHRLDVAFDGTLRSETEETAHHLHEFIKIGKTPKSVYSKKCESCSLKEMCMPKSFEGYESVQKYLDEIVRGQD